MSTIYPFDPTGQSNQNKIVDEIIPVPQIGVTDGYYIISLLGGFFYLNHLSPPLLTLTDNDGNVSELKYGSDWFGAYEFLTASLATGQSVYSGIALAGNYSNGSVSGNYNTGSIKIDSYQCLGSDWSLPEEWLTDQCLDINATSILISKFYRPVEELYKESNKPLKALPSIVNVNLNRDPIGIIDLNKTLIELKTALLNRLSTNTIHADLVKETKNNFNCDQIENIKSATDAENASLVDTRVATVAGLKAIQSIIPSTVLTQSDISNLPCYQVGNVIQSLVPLPKPYWLKLDPSIYLISSYPLLAEKCTKIGTDQFMLPAAVDTSVPSYIRTQPYIPPSPI